MKETMTVDIGAWARHARWHAVYKQLEDGSWAARVPGCVGAIAMAQTRCDVKHELLSVLEEWAEFVVQRGNALPAKEVIAGEVEVKR